LKDNKIISCSFFDSYEPQESLADPESAQSVSMLDSSDLVQQEMEAVSTLLDLGSLSQIDSEPAGTTLDEAEYFVKYANRSHIHNEWVKESTLTTFAKRKLSQFKRRYCNEPVDMFNKDWARPERIISRRKCRTGPGWELLIKWCDLGYEYCTWEAERARILNRPETVVLYIDLWKRQLNAIHKNSRQSRNLFREIRKQQFANYSPVMDTLIAAIDCWCRSKGSLSGCAGVSCTTTNWRCLIGSDLLGCRTREDSS